ncbi:MAG: acetylxylan esterase [Bryobacteraceae bacterium]
MATLSKALLVLWAASLAYGQQPIVTPFRADGIYAAGERVGWTVALPQGARAAGRYTYAIRQNNSETIQTAELDLSQGPATIETTRYEPAMLYLELTYPNATALHFGAAVAPTKMKPSVPRPADFDAFWDGKLKALAAIPAQPVVTKTETAQTGVELYTVKVQSVGSQVQGYLAKPSRPGKFPALVIYQYAGVYALQPSVVTDPAAEGWLAFDVDSHDQAPSSAIGAPPNYQAVGNTSRETSYFLNMYLRDARAIDYIASRPDWDGKTIVIMGTSMGGQQSLVTAALRRDQVTAVIVNVPSGADTHGDLYGSKAGYPNWPSSNPKVAETALYFDTVNFASRIKAPVLAALGFIDIIAAPAGIWRAVNQIPGRKGVIGMVESNHDNFTPEKQGEYRARSKAWLDSLLKSATVPPR